MRGLASKLSAAGICFVLSLPATASAETAPARARPPAGTLGAMAALPEAPEKALVLNYCSVCHDIDWVVMSGGTVEGWTDRITRMIRSGATIPKEQIPTVAAYLAKAFPPRPRSD